MASLPKACSCEDTSLSCRNYTDAAQQIVKPPKQTNLSRENGDGNIYKFFIENIVTSLCYYFCVSLEYTCFIRLAYRDSIMTSVFKSKQYFKSDAQYWEYPTFCHLYESKGLIRNMMKSEFKKRTPNSLLQILYLEVISASGLQSSSVSSMSGQS